MKLKNTKGKKKGWLTYRRGVASALGDVGRAGRHPPAVGAAVVRPVGTQRQRAGRGRTRAQGRLWRDGKERHIESRREIERRKEGREINTTPISKNASRAQATKVFIATHHFTHPTSVFLKPLVGAPQTFPNCVVSRIIVVHQLIQGLDDYLTFGIRCASSDWNK